MPDSSPFFSVVVPAYGVTEYIGETLKSISHQTLRDFEVIVVNDCCPDSARLEQVLAPFRDWILYIKHEKNRGVSAARNTGIRVARGEWVAFLDGDDVWEPDYLAVQMDMIKTYPEACLIYGNARIIGSVFNGKLSQSFSPSNGPATVESLLNETVNVSSMNVSRKSSLIAAGLFDETLRYAEDFDLWLRMISGGGIVKYHSTVIAGYRRRPGSLTCDVSMMYGSRMRILEKLARSPLLDPAERVALDAARIRWTAAMQLEVSKRDFAEGKNEEALAHLRSANAYLLKPHLSAIGFLMQYCPQLLRCCIWIRHRTLGY